MQKKYKLWIIIIIAELIVLIAVLAGISRTRSHSKALPFEIPQDQRTAYGSDDLTAITDNAYWTFVHQRFILVYDDEGVLQWVKIDNQFGRNDYNFDSTLVEQEGFQYYTENGEITSSVGIDVSKFQGTIDWAQVKAAGVDFAFVRVGYRGYGNGAIKLDETFDTNVAGALKNDLNVGVYFYSQATTYEEGVEEAQFVLDNVKAYNINLPIVLDTEDPMDDTARTSGLTREQRSEACRGFLETIKAAGYTPMIYASRNMFAQCLDMDRLGDYELWLAHYANVPNFPYKYTGWQYTESGSVDGIYGDVDLNLWFKD